MWYAYGCQWDNSSWWDQITQKVTTEGHPTASNKDQSPYYMHVVYLFDKRWIILVCKIFVWFIFSLLKLRGLQNYTQNTISWYIWYIWSFFFGIKEVPFLLENTQYMRPLETM